MMADNYIGWKMFDTVTIVSRPITKWNYETCENIATGECQGFIVDTKNKVLTYILFIKDCDKVNTAGIPQTKFIFDWIDVNEFLETVYSNKYVNYGDAYREFIVFSISQLFNIGDYIKTLKYTSNQEN